MNYNIACVIVTYNRMLLVRRCIDAVSRQTFKPICVYILDNASTDGTMEAVKEWGFFNSTVYDIHFHYILNKKNEGGAGGFYHGMKYAMENGDYDALWVMDDDGEPDVHCLERLVPYLETYDYIAPIVLSDKDHSTCSFVPDTNYEKFKERANEQGLVDGWASPMNGILFSSRLIRKIGYPKKEMFIWGDEINYHLRSISAGYTPVTVLDAIHFHPIDRVVGHKDESNKNIFIITDQKDWKLYCALRNQIYNLHIVYNK